ncbi:molybdate transport system substrate-binding protein [Paenibacillus taihuensis]|uniref:Molybdate transport system substrate-binding protein n=1 Tax=Paenibacillus taihuensis TaxID=1156355 RepID=A0A3D9S3C8_9BACL|nr:molybdate ABC transporter substrate-binding protein [Paenibacillus taihuensis]REE86525.1 molybdate transport system substrate-binding protein [Paenibacillus taihuensis]
MKSPALVILVPAVVCFLMALSACQLSASSKKVQLTISAAASLKDSLTAIKSSYEISHPNIDLRFNFGASGTLQKQLEQGAPADLFISAGSKQMDALVDEKLISKHATLLYNDLVMVVPTASGSTLTSIDQLSSSAVKAIAIGEPESVPAGQYAKDTLSALNLWDAVSSKLVYAKDVRQVLTYVETGNTEAGFVYKTDALTSMNAKITITVSPDLHKPIVYPAGIVAETKHSKEAADFYSYLQSSAADAVFTKYGFKL